MSILILMRHGQSIWNLQNRFTGGIDVPLTRKGIKQAKKAGKELKKMGISIDHVYSSKLSRSIETARCVMSNLESANINKQITKVSANFYYAKHTVVYQDHTRTTDLDYTKGVELSQENIKEGDTLASETFL